VIRSHEHQSYLAAQESLEYPLTANFLHLMNHVDRHALSKCLRYSQSSSSSSPSTSLSLSSSFDPSSAKKSISLTFEMTSEGSPSISCPSPLPLDLCDADTCLSPRGRDLYCGVPEASPRGKSQRHTLSACSRLSAVLAIAPSALHCEIATSTSRIQVSRKARCRWRRWRLDRSSDSGLHV